MKLSCVRLQAFLCVFSLLVFTGVTVWVAFKVLDDTRQHLAPAGREGFPVKM